MLLLNGSDSNASSGLLVDELSESSLVLDEAESDVLLSAELRKPNNGFNRVNIVSDDDESSLSFLD